MSQNVLQIVDEAFAAFKQHKNNNQGNQAIRSLYCGGKQLHDLLKEDSQEDKEKIKVYLEAILQ
jgi:hypothetical protein